MEHMETDTGQEHRRVQVSLAFDTTRSQQEIKDMLADLGLINLWVPQIITIRTY